MKKKNGVEGLSSLIKKLEGIPNNFEAFAAEEVKLAALDVHSIAVKSIQSNASKGNARPGGKGFASKPGNPPNTDTGALVRSIKIQVDEQIAYVGTNIKYGPWLEFGTEKMEPRPWLGPAFLKAAPKLVKKLAAIANKEIKKLK